MRQIVLDTETTGMDPSLGHKVIEVGCIELINRTQTDSTLQHYLNPERDSDEKALEVHGLTTEFLADKPKFHTIAQELYDYIKDTELLIHNAEFDIGFLDAEFAQCNKNHGTAFLPISDICSIIDTLQIARDKHPGQRNSLDALCSRYQIDNSNRTMHGALLDAELLAKAFLAMTGGQTSFSFTEPDAAIKTTKKFDTRHFNLIISYATDVEARAHESYMHEMRANQKEES